MSWFGAGVAMLGFLGAEPARYLSRPPRLHCLRIGDASPQRSYGQMGTNSIFTSTGSNIICGPSGVVVTVVTRRRNPRQASHRPVQRQGHVR
jgi:hypothetical protein